MTKVKIVNKSGQPVPAYATPLSAGMDLRACLDAPVTLGPLERTLVPTGLFIALPAGYEAQVRPRSGLAAKHGITVLNTPGTIDADYRGEMFPGNASRRWSSPATSGWNGKRSIPWTRRSAAPAASAALEDKLWKSASYMACSAPPRA